jgi:hypothetical protein
MRYKVTVTKYLGTTIKKTLPPRFFQFANDAISYASSQVSLSLSSEWEKRNQLIAGGQTSWGFGYDFVKINLCNDNLLF